jgi:hypothetical protein
MIRQINILTLMTLLTLGLFGCVIKLTIENVDVMQMLTLMTRYLTSHTRASSTTRVFYYARLILVEGE